MYRVALFGGLMLLTACKSDPVTLELSGETMGTTYNIVAIDASAELEQGDVQAAVDGALAAVNGSMSNWDPNSEISRFNASTSTDPVEISTDLLIVMEAAYDVHHASQGQFDVTLGPLIQLWGFGQRTSESPVPANADILAAQKIVGQSKVLSIDPQQGTMTKALPGTNVWLAALAKGFGIDQVADALDGLGIEDYMVEIGGDLVTKGVNPEGASWKIGIERPDAGAGTIEEVVTVTGRGMATSGDYRNYFEENGVRYSHIIDAETGRPIEHLTASVTVLADNGMMADAWATALLALGSERGIEVAEANNLGAFFIDRDPANGDNAFTTKASSRFSAQQSED